MKKKFDDLRVEIGVVLPFEMRGHCHLHPIPVVLENAH